MTVSRRLLPFVLLMSLPAAAWAGERGDATFDLAASSPGVELVLTGGAPHLAGQLLVKFEGAGPRLVDLGRALGVPLERVMTLSGGEWLLVTPDRTRPLPELVAALRARPDVAYAQPNYVVQIQAVPTDPNYQYQWHYEAIDLPAAWEIETGDAGIVVAVIDSGITDHPDLINKRVDGFDMVSLRLNSADGDGRDADPTDPGRMPIFHGTHVAGTVGAETNNDLGVAGVCWGCSVQPVRALGSMWGSSADIIDAIRWSAGLPVGDLPLNETPADVINMSLGGNLGEGATCGVDDPATQSAVDDAIAAGSIIVAAAGNSHADAAAFTPASCDGVITVAALTRGGFMAYYTNFGDTIDVAAPGGGLLGFIWSTWEQDLYMGFLGTSQASPHVAGLVGLLLSANPRLSTEEVLDILQSTATPLDPRCGRGCGAGKVDADRAVMAALER